jgi:hypothetical protein
MYRLLLALQRERFERRDQPIAELCGLIIKQHQEVVTRLAEVPGWSGSGFGSAGDRRNGADGQHVSLDG